MYGFVLNMWVMKKIDGAKVNNYAVKTFITEEEAKMILATPQIM
jgi:hypothetical protein